jgi:hypothetical protein
MTNDQELQSRSWVGSPMDSGEDASQLICLLPKNSCRIFCFSTGRHEHPQPVFCLSRFSATETDSIPKLAPGRRFVRLTIVCTHAACRAGQLTDQWLCDGSPRNTLTELDHRFAESRGSLFKVETCRFLIACHCRPAFCSSLVIGH